ncbi:MAG: hypothetical protein HFH68_08540 [Lachnospiraceae bacterium]|nr:hypothetical protein [Lachnospiraceae bacterium]
MDSLLERRLEEARKGRLYWLYLLEKYQLDFAGYVLLIPDKEDIVHLKESFTQYIAKKSGSKGVIIICQELASMAGCKEDSINNVYIETCTIQEAENLMRFYCMYQFTPNLLIASLEKPDGRRGINLAGKEGLSREEILDMVVFGIEKG